jgi:hypothetical protein
MNISWVLADSVMMDPLADISKMKELKSKIEEIYD